MNKLKINTHPEVEMVFNNYPKLVHEKISNLRRLIFETANEIDNLNEVEETLKWGEPSYLVKKGSTIRVDWKPKKPNQYAMYFKCTSRLVATFKQVFGDVFNYEGNRAIVFRLEDKVPEFELKKCIEAGLTYHIVKNHPTLNL